MQKIETRPLIFDPNEIGRAGVFVTLERYGALAVYRGDVRRQDEPVEETAAQDGVDPAMAGQGEDCDLGDGHVGPAHVGAIIMSSGQLIGTDLPEDDAALKPLPERLVMELRALRHASYHPTSPAPAEEFSQEAGPDSGPTPHGGKSAA
jgi:ParB family chromosome partitioning protein